ncbi:sodium-dependent glucose transporter 1-like [Argopecten irradians]|uniref:sodium-dependent glucose transporter 1-like n=1 Tax=Argopecten irradians TaxID=31199 RepID=UPI00371706A4
MKNTITEDPVRHGATPNYQYGSNESMDTGTSVNGIHCNIQDKYKKPSLFTEVKQNKHIRVKVVTSILIITAMMMVGYNQGQLRPMFPDLIEIVDVDLEKGSAIVTSYFSGRLVGSVLGGFLHSKTNRYLLIVVSLTIDSGVVAVIPWCSVYELMLAVHSLHGTLIGVLNIAVNTVAIQLWGSTSRGRAYVLMVFAFLDIAYALAPFGTAPFLQENQQLLDENQNNTDNHLITSNDSVAHPSPPHDPDSELYKAYSISSGIMILVSISFVLLLTTTKSVYSSGFICLTASAYIFADIGMWISASITGLATSIIWPTTLSWMNSYLIRIDGKVSCYLLVIGLVFALFTPPVLGQLIQEVSMLWFCYICVIASVLNVVSVMFIVIHTRVYDRRRKVYTVEIYTVESSNRAEIQDAVS